MVAIAKGDGWSRSNPVWKVTFPISWPEMLPPFRVPGLDLPVEVDTITASVTVMGKAAAEKVKQKLMGLVSSVEE
jgi:hypothetical protein